MKTYKNKYKGLRIVIDEVDENRCNYKITDPLNDDALVEDTEGYCVTVDEAMGICKDVIDEIREEF